MSVKLLAGRRKALITSIAVIAAIIAAVGAGVLFRNMQGDDGTQPPAGGGGGQLEDRRSEETKRAQELALSGKPEEASRYINEQLASGNVSDSQKYDLYLQQGVIAYEQGKHQEAYDSYKRAEGAKQTREISELLADAATAMGKKEDAVKHLKDAIGRMDTDGPTYEDDKALIEDKIRGLGGSV